MKAGGMKREVKDEGEGERKIRKKRRLRMKERR